MYEDLEHSLKKLYSEVPSPSAELVTGRERMLAEATRLRGQVVRLPLSAEETRRPERRRRMNLMLAYKVLAVVMAAVVAITGAGGGVVLAAGSLPGDLLYPVKLISEDVRFALALQPADRAELAMAFVGERVHEMETLANQGEVVPDTVLRRMTRQTEQVMAEIAQARPEEVPALLERVMERSREHQQVLEQAGTGAREEIQTRLRQASQIMERVHQSNGDALNDPTRFQQEYQHRYDGAPGPHGDGSPTATSDPERSQEEYQHRYEGTPGPHGEPSQSPSPVNDPERSQEEYQHRYEGTPGPHGEQSPSPSEPQRTQEEHQHRQEGTPGPHGEQSTPEATSEPKHGGQSGSGH